MNNELNNEIETLTPDVDNIDVLDSNIENQEAVSQNVSNVVPVQPVAPTINTNQTINPNAYHPSLNNNQNNTVNNVQNDNISNNSGIGQTRHISFNRAEVENNNTNQQQNSIPINTAVSHETDAQTRVINNRTVLAESVIVLIVSLLIEFLAAPHAMVRLLMYAVEKIFKYMLNGGSKFIYDISTFVILTLALGILIFAFVFMLYAIYNIISRKNLLSDVISKGIKIFLYSFLAAFAIMLVDKLFGTDISDLVIRVTTFNYKTVNYILTSYL